MVRSIEMMRMIHTYTDRKRERESELKKSYRGGRSEDEKERPKQICAALFPALPPSTPLSTSHFLRLTIFVTACRTVIPARSTSLRDRPTVTHTFSAGGGCQSAAAAAASPPRRLLLRVAAADDAAVAAAAAAVNDDDELVVVGIRFRRQMSTLLFMHYLYVSGFLFLVGVGGV